jgi:hypothetical protein
MRQLRAWLAAQSIESLATNYVVMTESMTMKIHDTNPPTAEMLVVRPRIYNTQDLEKEIKRRLAIDMEIANPEEREFIIQVAFQDTIEKAKTIYQMLGG